MKRILLITFIFLSIHHQANANDSKKAVSSTVKAILQVPLLKKYRKKISKRIRRKINVSKTTWAALGNTAVLIKDQKLSTVPIKKFRIKTLGGELRPDVIHSFKNKTTLGKMGIQWSY